MNQEHKKISKKESLKFEAAAVHESEKWEEGSYGKDPQYIQFQDENTEKVFHDSKRKSENIPTSIRMPKELIDGLQNLAEEDGLPYQTYVKMVLKQHLKSKNKKRA